MALVVMAAIIPDFTPKAEAVIPIVIPFILGLAALLVATGVVFTSEMQAQSLATHLDQQMPPDLRSRLEQEFAEPNIKYQVGHMFLDPLVDNAVSIAGDVYDDFKSWASSVLGINQGVLDIGTFDLTSVGLTGRTVTFEMSGGTVTAPIYEWNKVWSLTTNIYVSAIAWSSAVLMKDFKIGEQQFTFEPDLSSQGYYELKRGGTRVISVTYENWVNGRVVIGLNGNILNMGFMGLSGAYEGRIANTCQLYPSYMEGVADTNLALQAEGYTRELTLDEQDKTLVGLPSSMAHVPGLTWGDITTGVGVINPPAVRTIPQLVDDINALLGGYYVEGFDLTAKLTDLKILVEGISLVYEDVLVAIGVLEGIEAAILAAIAAGVLTPTLTQSLTYTATQEYERIKAKYGVAQPPGIAPPVFQMFPFCIPFDVIHFFQAIAAAPVSPSFEVSIIPASVTSKWGFSLPPVVIDFSEFEVARQIVRNGLLILFVAGLLVVTKNYIWTGGG